MTSYKYINGKLVPVNVTTVFSVPPTLEDILNNQEIGEETIDAAKEFAPQAKDTVIRALRTAVQTFIGAVTLSLPTALATVTTLPQLETAAISVGASALVAAWTATVAYVHNTLEANGVIRSTKGN